MIHRLRFAAFASLVLGGAFLAVGIDSAFGAGNHFGWCRGVGNKHHSADCSAQGSGGADDAKGQSAAESDPPTANQESDSGTDLLPTPTTVPAPEPAPRPTSGQGPQPRPQPDREAETAATTRTTPAFLSAVVMHPPRGPSFITEKAGRQKAHAIPRFEDAMTGALWDCVASGIGQRYVDEDSGVSGVLSHVDTTDLLFADVPAVHPRQPGCVIAVKRRHVKGG